jgi:hypothetical protein
MGMSYERGSDLTRLKNGVTFYGSMTPGEFHICDSVVEFPDGTEMREYEQISNEGHPDTDVFKALSIEYPDGRKVKNPSADEINVLFREDGRDAEIEIRDITALTTAEKDALPACGEKVQAAYARALELRQTLPDHDWR